MSGPTWLPQKTLGIPERAVATMSNSVPAFYRPVKKNPSDQKPRFGVYDQNRSAGGSNVPTRYMATGPSGKMPSCYNT